MKSSQNFYGEMFLKALGRTTGRQDRRASGRQVVREVLGTWGIPADAFVMNDGSGLSRYDYVTADAIVAILKHVWNDPRLRGPFLAALPVGAHDGTLESRMRGTILDGQRAGEDRHHLQHALAVWLPRDEVRRAHRLFDHRQPLHGAERRHRRGSGKGVDSGG